MESAVKKFSIRLTGGGSCGVIVLVGIFTARFTNTIGVYNKMMQRSIVASSP